MFLSFSAHWILTQYTKGVWEQLAVSVVGIVIMVGAAWLLGRAEQVPNLFVKVTEIEEADTALDNLPATTAAATPAAH